jgi:hypothetical protein
MTGVRKLTPVNFLTPKKIFQNLCGGRAPGSAHAVFDNQIVSLRSLTLAWRLFQTARFAR